MVLARTKNNVLSAVDKSQTHYDVYIYHHPANTNDQVQDWERKSSTAKAWRAILKAKTLHKSKKYQKVEVKKRRFDSKRDCVFASTLKVYSTDTKYKILLLGLVAVAAFSSSIIAILLYAS